jgi:hypothetical protein
MFERLVRSTTPSAKNLNSAAVLILNAGTLCADRIEGRITMETEHTVDKLVGTWKLVSASSTQSNGEPSEAPYGASPIGFLTYTADGRVTALISHGGRKPLSIGGKPAALVEEQAEAFKTFLAYGGRYTFSGDTVTHYVDISSIQNFVGKELVRTVKFQGDRIILAIPPALMNGKIQTLELIWQRLPAGN